MRDQRGAKVEDDDNNYFGSMLWDAWAKQTWSMRRDGPTDHYVELSSVKDRNRVCKLGKQELILVEPNPLLFVPRTTGLGPTSMAVGEVLRN